jgi:hypothetical protein
MVARFHWCLIIHRGGINLLATWRVKQSSSNSTEVTGIISFSFRFSHNYVDEPLVRLLVVLEIYRVPVGMVTAPSYAETLITGYCIEFKVKSAKVFVCTVYRLRASFIALRYPSPLILLTFTRRLQPAYCIASTVSCYSVYSILHCIAPHTRQLKRDPINMQCKVPSLRGYPV